MYDAALMQVPDSIDDRTDNLPSLFLSIDYLLGDLVVKLATWKVLQHEVDMLIIREIVVKFDDIGVLDVLHDVDFPLEQNFLLFVHFLSS